MNSDIEEGTVAKFISTAVSGFLNNDLMSSLQFFLKRAKGSFGLCVTSSIDAKRQLALASRGQTISVAVFPQEGMILWGSEQSAVKAAMDAVPIAQTTDPDQRAMRLDLDDLGGEIILLVFSSSDVRREAIDSNAKEDSAGSKRYKRMTSLAPSVIKGMDIRMGPLQTCTVCAFVPMSKAADKDMRARMIPLRDNPLIHPMPVFEKDGVHLDIRYQQSNRMDTWKRLSSKAEGERREVNESKGGRHRYSCYRLRGLSMAWGAVLFRSWERV